jgi:hypothetical protein
MPFFHWENKKQKQTPTVLFLLWTSHSSSTTFSEWSLMIRRLLWRLSECLQFKLFRPGKGFNCFFYFCLNAFVLFWRLPCPSLLQTEVELTNFRLSPLSNFPTLIMQCFSECGPGNNIWEGMAGRRERPQRGWWERTWWKCTMNTNNIVMKHITLCNEYALKRKWNKGERKNMQTVGLPHTREPVFMF